MNYKHIDAIYTPKDKIIIVDNSFSFTLPSCKRTCVAKGRAMFVQKTLTLGSMDYDLTIGKKNVLHLNWLPKALSADTSYDKDIDRSEDFTGAIKKKTKGWDKKDAKTVIEAFDYMIRSIRAYFAVYGLKGKPKKK